MGQDEEKIYYIETITDASTRIGKTIIMPNMPPVGFTEKQFKANKRDIEHYEGQGIIMFSRPGTKDSVRAAREIKVAIARQDEIVAGGKLPPAPMERKLGYMDPEPEPLPVADIPKFSAPSKTDDYRCAAVTASGMRCKRDTVPDFVLCNIHIRMLKNGKKIMTHDGNRIARDGKSIEGK